jgi:hypothetical protein
MKKVIFCIGAMLIAATGFSQNLSEIEQHGQNYADVDQTSTIDVLYNYSDLYQRGVGNDADINQVGENSSVVFQQWNRNNAIINQTGGDGNQGYGSALMQESEVHQEGWWNMADVTQAGEGNESFVGQFNAGNAPMFGNTALIDQEGLINESTVSQTGDANWAQTNQFGHGNMSITEQITYDLAAALHPSGYLQGSLVDQVGELNYANVYQNGDNQASIITQSADAPFEGELWTNEAWVIQNGELNLSIIEQSDCTLTSPATAAANNFAEVTQTNTVGSLGGNISTLWQTGGNSAVVNQLNGGNN